MPVAVSRATFAPLCGCSQKPPQRLLVLSGTNTTGAAVVPLIWIVPPGRTQNSTPGAQRTMVPAPMVNVAPAATLTVPVTWMRALLPQFSLPPRLPVFVVHAVVSSITIGACPVRPFTDASKAVAPPVVAALRMVEPQPRRSSTGFAGKFSARTRPFRNRGSPAAAPNDAPFVSRAATGTGRPFGYTAGTIMFRTASAKAEGASMTRRKGLIVGIPSSVLPRSLFRTMNA